METDWVFYQLTNQAGGFKLTIGEREAKLPHLNHGYIQELQVYGPKNNIQK